MEKLKTFKDWFTYEVEKFGMPSKENILKAIKVILENKEIKR